MEMRDYDQSFSKKNSRILMVHSILKKAVYATLNSNQKLADRWMAFITEI